jgi:hypothetical protein
MEISEKLGVVAIVGFAAASLTLGASPACAVPITYTETDTASGSLNGVAFSNATIVLSETSDTTNVTNPSPGFFENVGTITLSINGTAPVTFTGTPTGVSVDQATGFGNPLADFFDSSVGIIIGALDPAFGTYDLTTAIGPITATGVVFAGDTFFPTSGGGFILTGVFEPTFTATIPAVPEPNSLAILASAVAGLGFLFNRGWRRRA